MQNRAREPAGARTRTALPAGDTESRPAHKSGARAAHRDSCPRPKTRARPGRRETARHSGRRPTAADGCRKRRANLQVRAPEPPCRPATPSRGRHAAAARTPRTAARDLGRRRGHFRTKPRDERATTTNARHPGRGAHCARRPVTAVEDAGTAGPAADGPAHTDRRAAAAGGIGRPCGTSRPNRARKGSAARRRRAALPLRILMGDPPMALAQTIGDDVVEAPAAILLRTLTLIKRRIQAHLIAVTRGVGIARGARLGGIGETPKLDADRGERRDQRPAGGRRRRHIVGRSRSDSGSAVAGGRSR